MAIPRRRHLRLVGIIGLGLALCTHAAGYLLQTGLAASSEQFVWSTHRYMEPIATSDSSHSKLVGWSKPSDDQLVHQPFGMETEPVGGDLASKWRTVEFEISQQERVLANCRAQQPCPEPARDLLKIVAEGGGHTGRARVGLINRAVNSAIIPTADAAQWGAEDHWSSPFETLQTRRGDCEDYAILKYVALRQAGLSSENVKIAILRNFFPNEDHAVVVVRVEEEWLILDNRWLALVRDSDMIRATPKFLLDEHGVHRFVSPKSHQV